MTTDKTSRNGELHVIEIPDSGQLKINLAKLYSTDFSNKSVDDVVKETEQLIGVVPQQIASFAAPLPVYRARTGLIDKEQETQAKSFYSPPAALAQQNRANLEGNPVFYASLDPETPCKEMGIAPDEQVWVAEFEMKKGCSFWVKNFTIPTLESTTGPGLMNTGTRELVKKIVAGTIENFQTTHTEDQLLESIHAFPYIFAMNNYELSARIAHSWIYSTTRDVPAIMYSSNKDFDKYNLAIRPQVIDELFTLKFITKCLYDSETGTFTFDKRGRPTSQDSSVIEWQDCRHWGKGRYINDQFVYENSSQSPNISYSVSEPATHLFGSPEELEDFLSGLSPSTDTK